MASSDTPKENKKEKVLSTSASRSYNMSRIKGKDTKPEILLRKALWKKNIRYRLHANDLPGRPDIFIKKYKLAIFIDGEFWHGFEWHKSKLAIKSNREFWISKIEKNIDRDRKTNLALNEMGYTVFRFWAKDVTTNIDICLNQILLFLETVKEIKIPERNDTMPR